MKSNLMDSQLNVVHTLVGGPERRVSACIVRMLLPVSQREVKYALALMRRSDDNHDSPGTASDSSGPTPP
jgi:hypothetical protein